MCACDKNMRPVTKKIWQTIALVGSISLFTVAVALTGTVIFQKTYFTPFWVNGQSMYPTLNKNAKYSNGTPIGERRIPGNVDGDYDVDYGFMDTHQTAINKISRFKIVIFRAREDIISYNIKRVIALPGETFYITSSTDLNENGKLYVKNPNSGLFEFVEQPVDQDFVKNGAYTEEYTVPTTLGENEYFVMGDNRIGENSLDSRKTGPVNKSLILGVAVGLNGVCTLANTQDNIVPINIKHYWPRWL